MFMKNLLGLIVFILLLSSCNKENSIEFQNDKNYSHNFVAPDEFHNQNQFVCLEPELAEAGQIFHLDNKVWLWGGRNLTQAFNVSNWSLKIEQLGSGLGRETIESLIHPKYNNTNKAYKNEGAILVESNDHYKAYPLNLMAKYEVVNDEIDGVPIVIAYCPLANLSVVYERSMCNTELFFATSGYTYKENTKIHNKQNLITNNDGEVESFVLWDRNTESLWYPLMDIGVSGEMLGKTLKTLSKAKWRVVENLNLETAMLDKQVKVLGENEQLNLIANITNIISKGINCN